MEMDPKKEEEKKDQQSFQAGLALQAKRAGKRYWIRVIVGFFVMIFLVFSACNIYLQLRYSKVFQESPCQLCYDLNIQASGCFLESDYLPLQKTSMFAINPASEFIDKIFWISRPCDACSAISPDHKKCLDLVFGKDKQKINSVVQLKP